MFLVVLHGQKRIWKQNSLLTLYNRLYVQLYPRFAALVLYSKKYTEPWYCTYWVYVIFNTFVGLLNELRMKKIKLEWCVLELSSVKACRRANIKIWRQHTFEMVSMYSVELVTHSLIYSLTLNKKRHYICYLIYYIFVTEYETQNLQVRNYTGEFFIYFLTFRWHTRKKESQTLEEQRVIATITNFRANSPKVPSRIETKNDLIH